GLMSPLCSCGILPVVVTLIECGIPLAPVMALFITSPIMSPEALVLTYLTLGEHLAFAKLIGACFMGLGAGFLTYFLQKTNFFETDVLKMHKFIDSCIVKAKDMETAKQGEIPIDAIVADDKATFFLKRAKELFRFMIKFVLIATFIEAIIVIFIPMDWIISLLGNQTQFSPLWATLFGIPMPANGISIVPIIKGLIDKGMGNKAAISLLIAAPVTSIPAIIALNGLFKKRVVIIFLISSILGSVMLGYLLG
ncbi:permease, partial [Candidatus Poribacteria bacterium]|nr:permease [Candidatus Poribacteria bacterium]